MLQKSICTANGQIFVSATGLVEFGDALKQMADVKYSLDDNIKQNFLEPLHHLQTKDLKEVMVSELGINDTGQQSWINFVL